MTKIIQDLSARRAFELQAYLAPITRDLGCPGVGWRDDAALRGSGAGIDYIETRWAHLRDKLEHQSEISTFVEELIEALRNAEMA
jgi:hypothetical protein